MMECRGTMVSAKARGEAVPKELVRVVGSESHCLDFYQIAVAYGPCLEGQCVQGVHRYTQVAQNINSFEIDHTINRSLLLHGTN